uniref:Uncharacterized protein n=1 Tax=Rhizophora mucronata TaxID=61149 RepID=A0A2P2ISQ9_RHIMU
MMLIKIQCKYFHLNVVNLLSFCFILC